MGRYILKNKIIGTVFLATFILTTTGCSDDFGDAHDSPSNAIRFQVVDNTARSSADAREGVANTSSFSILTSAETPDSLYLYSQMADMSVPCVGSRGSLTPSMSDFYMACSLTSGSDFLGYYFKSVQFSNEGENQSGHEYYWANTGTHDYRFFGVAPGSGFGSKYSMTYPAAAQAPAISYTVPNDPDRQIDLLGVTTSTYPDTYKAVVPVQFKHLCTAITFRADASVFPGVIKKITLEGIKSSGVYDMATGEWTLSGATDTYVSSPNKSVDEDDTVITPDGQATFFLLPQTLGDGAKVTVEYLNPISNGEYTLTGDISGAVWPMGKVITYVVSTSGITAVQSGLNIVGTADAALLPATLSLKPLNALGPENEILSTPQSITAPGFTIPGSSFLDDLIDKGLTGKQYYLVTITNVDDPNNKQELMVEYQFDYMEYTIDVDDTSTPVRTPFDVRNTAQPSGNPPSTILVRWEPNVFSDQFTEVTTENYSYTYSISGTRNVRIYSNLQGKYAVPSYGVYEGTKTNPGENFPWCTVSVNTPLLSSPNKELKFTFINCTKLNSVSVNLFDNFGEATSVLGLFQNCQSLISVPEHLFDNLVNVTNFQRAFRDCTGLLSIPSNLFDQCVNASSMAYTFSNCANLQSIPAGLFDKTTKVDGFSNVFQNCQSITEIPSGLFDNCPDVTDFNYAFQACTSLTSIPDGLFDHNPKVRYFNNVFQSCSSLQYIPARLFANCPLALEFSMIFHTCSSLTSVPDDIFAGCDKVTTFYGAFNGCTNLATISPNIFQSCPNVTDFDGVFKSTGLISVPSGIFADKKKCTTFAGAFQTCASLQSFPDDLFADCSSAYMFNALFASCGNLSTPIPEGFFKNCAREKITELNSIFERCWVLPGPLPADLFDGMTNLTSLQRIFYEARSLSGSIPANLFATNPNLSDMTETFAFCNSLSGPIPQGLFDNNTQLTKMYRTFINCNLLTAIPTDLFDNCPLINNLTGTFDRCYWVSGDVPTLWISYPTAAHNYCFYRIGLQEGSTTSTVTNYDDIPDDWKGNDNLTL